MVRDELNADGRGWTTWPAPAKLNLFLHIVGRRDDGYHLLQTIFQIVDWGDQVHLRLRNDAQIVRVEDSAKIDYGSDLCVRAALLLQRHTGFNRGADVRVDKRIPIGGGLGGGSSDAASTLVGLNEIWGIGLDIDTLADLGQQLGADVPIFVRGKSAWAEGIGERLTPIELPQRWYVIVDPAVHVPTAPLFQASELTRNCAPVTIGGYLAGAQTTNVFAAVVRLRYPQVNAAMRWLEGFGSAQLTGSGGCVFCSLATEASAREIVARCPAQFEAHFARGVARSALRERVDMHRSMYPD